MHETEGEVYNIGQSSVFQHQQAEIVTENTGLKKSNSKMMFMLTEMNEDHLIGEVKELNASNSLI